MEKTYYLTKEDYLTVIATWKMVIGHTVQDHILYNILRCKPADYGFSEKKNNIQGDDPWYAFNTTHGDLNYKLKHRPEIFGNYFKTRFGIDVPVGLADKLNGLRK